MNGGLKRVVIRGEKTLTAPTPRDDICLGTLLLLNNIYIIIIIIHNMYIEIYTYIYTSIATWIKNPFGRTRSEHDP